MHQFSLICMPNMLKSQNIKIIIVLSQLALYYMDSK